MIAVVTLGAYIIDYLIGDPDYIYKRFPHPVSWFAANLKFFEKHLYAPRKVNGAACLLITIFIAVIPAYYLEYWLLEFGTIGQLLIAIAASVLLASKSLIAHVTQVKTSLENETLEQARIAVSKIVGRETDQLDRPAISRATIESLAENFSDGVVAPLLWLITFGLPGIVLYKVVNTADSLIGHKSDKYYHFGWFAAKLDDVLNLVPARLTALLIILSTFFFKHTNSKKAFETCLKEANLHLSPNAGWPETAVAGALGIALGGPRYYEGVLVQGTWFNKNGRQAAVLHIENALILTNISLLIILTLLTLHAIFI